MSSSTPLTTYLTTSCPHPLTRATTHPFLACAGRGALPKPLLSQWLSQDRLYAHAYIRFIGLLLSKIRLPAHNPDAARSAAQTAAHRAADILIDALVNIRRELGFFEEVAAEFGLDLTAISPEDGMVLSSADTGVRTGGKTAAESSSAAATATGGVGGAGCVPGKEDGGCCGSREGGKPTTSAGRGDPEKGCTIFFGPTRTTRAYIDLFMSAGSPGVSLLEGLVVLWATEECYLRAWRYARGFMDERGAGQGGGDADGGALRTRFIPNWTSGEFEGFVRSVGDVVDEMAGLVKGAEEGEMRRGQCLEWWRQVLWLEERFWPVVE
jgi:thiaminase